MYLKWSSPSRWRFKRGPRPPPPSGGGIGWRPPSGLAKVWPRLKTGLFQTIAATPSFKQKQGKCASPGVRSPNSMVCEHVCVCLSGERARKGVQAPENTDPNLSKHSEDHLEGFSLWNTQLNMSVPKHVTHSRIKHSSHQVKCVLHTWTS